LLYLSIDLPYWVERIPDLTSYGFPESPLALS